MIWSFYIWTAIFTIGGILLTIHLFHHKKSSARGALIVIGIVSFLTILPGRWGRETPEQKVLFAKDKVQASKRQFKKRKLSGRLLIRKKCVRCHGLDRLRSYKNNDWEDIIERMTVFGLEITYEEARKIIMHLKKKRPF